MGIGDAEWEWGVIDPRGLEGDRMGGNTGAPRDVFADPQPGDVVESAAARDQLHVHYRIADEVYCGKWSKEGASLGLVRGSVKQWQRDCASVGARVLQRGEDLRGSNR